MTKEDILCMTRKAGIDAWWESGNEDRECLQDHLEHFAGLVMASEREVCAKGIEDSTDGMSGIGEWSEGYLQAAKDIAAGIRARGDE